MDGLKPPKIEKIVAYNLGVISLTTLKKVTTALGLEDPLVCSDAGELTELVENSLVVLELRQNAMEDLRFVVDLYSKRRALLFAMECPDKQMGTALEETNIEYCFKGHQIENEAKLSTFIAEVKDPQSEWNYHHQVMDLLRTRQLKQAEAMIQHKLKADPGNMKYLVHFAELAFLAGETKKSIEVLEKVLRVKADYLPALNIYANAQMRLSKPADALPALERAVAKSPYNIDRLLMLGDVRRVTHKGNAKDCFERVLQLNPHEEKARMGLGKIFLQAGKLEEAKKEFDNCADKSALATQLNAQVLTFLGAGNYDEAIPYLHVLLNYLDDKKKPFIMHNLALAHFRNGSSEEAHKIAEECGATYPQFTKASELLNEIQKAVADGTAPKPKQNKSQKGAKTDVASPAQETKPERVKFIFFEVDSP